MNAKCLFLDGPIDGQMHDIPPSDNVWYVPVRKPINYFDMGALSDAVIVESGYTEHKYVRTSSRTFLYDKEMN